MPIPRWSRASPSAQPKQGHGCISGAPATTRCSRRCGSISSMSVRTSTTARCTSPERWTNWLSASGTPRCPATRTCSPRCRARYALWAGAYATELRDDAAGLLAAKRRLDQNPLGSAAGYGVPVLPLDRESTRRELGFERTQEPVTAVQLSRGKGESQLLFEIHLLLTDLGRMAADLILFCTQEFSFVALPAHMTTGSSIMPQKRNPDVFELIRGRCSTSMGCLVEALSVTTKLTSGYHRDLQLIKAPLFKGIDLAGDVLSVLATALPDIRFIPENIRMEQSLYATEEAYRLTVDEGIPFREAYRRIGARFRPGES